MFKVTFPNMNYKFDESNQVSDNVVNKSDEEIIIEAIIENNQVYRKELLLRIKKSVKTVERIIKNSNKIIRVGSPKAGHWEISKWNLYAKTRSFMKKCVFLLTDRFLYGILSLR